MKRELKNGVIIGGMAGVLLWLYDFRYILLGGPPGTRVADLINDILSTDLICGIGLEGANVLCSTLFPLFVLTAVGMVSGLILLIIIRMVRS